MIYAEMVVEGEASRCIEEECKSFCTEEGFLDGKCIDITCFCSSRPITINEHSTGPGQKQTDL